MGSGSCPARASLNRQCQRLRTSCRPLQSNASAAPTDCVMWTRWELSSREFCLGGTASAGSLLRIQSQIPVPRQVLIVCRILDRGRSMPLSAALEVPFARAHITPALLQDGQNARSLHRLGAFSSTAASGRRKSGMLWKTQVSPYLSRGKSQAARKHRSMGDGSAHLML